ncbi:MAG TPA: pseudouridine synthase [Cyanobacteria bacterium UBA11149]|nr:pseudouridine synthase [Cyanobacteria bacterium UBA11367]HBE56746.1 pseudouridine synthase [Cyanobacteria bacterium UBA11366]HBK62291.1 pseudouridine synthase [Cyanobacteria bacterium UBA11166]HBR72633.1 pseudouridine synthase [Cyanobacteria bacterium UBA11159]HBS70339.1 pseudouridine synthase [Cyanobacteria bacterium UBA11153]HBW89331.1 pseudouridine synthase [Cyanobacteria bacterium UBA11149]HCA93845.1 pseudouridine synthase [Cyanobacteria bacterium UBA9226]
MEERVQKILSQWGIASRRQAEKMILAGLVKLNGKVVNLGQKANPDTDAIEVNGKLLQSGNRPELIYLLLNKPRGVVSTCRDSHKCNTMQEKRNTVLDLLPKPLREGKGVHPVGRLDAESTGALILTNDGALTFELTHPRYHIPKTYQVWVRGNPPESVIESWCQGINLDGKKTLPARVKILKLQGEETLLEIILTEGRNRQIRRVADLLGYPVIHLHRTAIGQIKLQIPGEPVLTSGHYRYLRSFEVRFLQNRVHQTSLKVLADIKEYRV